MWSINLAAECNRHHFPPSCFLNKRKSKHSKAWNVLTLSTHFICIKHFLPSHSNHWFFMTSFSLYGRKMWPSFHTHHSARIMKSSYTKAVQGPVLICSLLEQLSGGRKGLFYLTFPSIGPSLREVKTGIWCRNQGGRKLADSCSASFLIQCRDAAERCCPRWAVSSRIHHHQDNLSQAWS